MPTELKTKQVEVNGNTYESVTEISRTSCEGCVVRYDDYTCDRICSEASSYSCDGIIWIEKEKTEVQPEVQTENTPEQKYTIEEFSEAYSNCVGVHVGGWEMLQIKKYLAKQSSPEYQLYLKLKQQFGE